MRVRVRMTQAVSDHERRYEIDEVCELSSERAGYFVAQGMAELVNVVEAPARLESAAVTPVMERAVLGRAPKRSVEK